MLPSASDLACRREERVQKAFSVDHHGPGDARLSHRATAIYGEHSDYVSVMEALHVQVATAAMEVPHAQVTTAAIEAPHAQVATAAMKAPPPHVLQLMVATATGV